MGQRRRSGLWPATEALVLWIRRKSVGVQIVFGVAAFVGPLALIWFLVHERELLFIASQIAHAAGLLVLVYKLTRRNSCNGLSLKSQELTAFYLALRLLCIVATDKDFPILLIDAATLFATLWVVYMMRAKLKQSYLADSDNMKHYILVVPCMLLAILVHPISVNSWIVNYLAAFIIYLEAIAVLPQLHMMQNAKIVEPFTGHYVFALGVARFFNGAYWIIEVIETGGAFLFHDGHGVLWIPSIIICEILQTFILADFCYYYVKNAMYDQLLTGIDFGVKPAV